MKIKKYKYLNNSKYKVTIDNEQFILYEDIIVKYQILLKKEIIKEELNKYLKENIYFDNYYKAISYINIRQRSKKEINEFLSKNDSSLKDNAEIVRRLEHEGYIDEKKYCQSYINDCVYLKNDGPIKIINNLKKLGINEDIISQEIKIFSKEQQQEKIKKYIAKQVLLNKNKALLILKNKLLNNLLKMGYEKDDILSYLNDIQIDEDVLYQQEYQKAYNKLAKKYIGKELELRVKQKLYQKGFRQ